MKDRFDIINVKERSKRGLIDGLGTIIKTITGNMENIDAQEINKLISTIQLNQHDIKTLDSQHTLNQNMIDRFDNITNYINKERGALQEFINSLRLKNKDTRSEIAKKLSSNQFYFSVIN